MNLKFLTTRLKQIKLSMIWVKKTAKISALTSKDLLEKYEYLTGKDFGQRPSVLEKTKFEYSPLGMSISKAFEKDKAKSSDNCKSDFNYDSNYIDFTNFLKAVMNLKRCH